MDLAQVMQLSNMLNRVIDRLTLPGANYVLTKSERSYIDLFILMFRGGEKKFNNLAEALELFTSTLPCIKQTIDQHQGE
jgi:hypothetical protein